MKYPRECIKPAVDYFDEHLKTDITSVLLKAFKATCLFSPYFIKKIKPECTALDRLSALPFITPSTLLELK